MKSRELDLDLLFSGASLWVEGYPFELPDLYNTYGPYEFDKFGTMEKFFEYINSINIHLCAVVCVHSRLRFVLEKSFDKYLHERSF